MNGEYVNMEKEVESMKKANAATYVLKSCRKRAKEEKMEMCEDRRIKLFFPFFKKK